MKKKPLITLSEKVQKGLNECDILVPIITPNSIGNQWVNQEIGYAIGKGKEIIPIIATDCFNQLKGFINSQVDCPFQYKSNEIESKETQSFKVICEELVNFIIPSLQQNLTSSIDKTEVNQGELYTTHVHFQGKLHHGFFDNYIEHIGSDFYRWNPDYGTFPKSGTNITPGSLQGEINIKTSYSHSTKDWPKGIYKIYVRVYDHQVPGETTRLLVTENLHELRVE